MQPIPYGKWRRTWANSLNKLSAVGQAFKYHSLVASPRSISEESSATQLLPTVELSSGPSSPGVDTSNPQAKTEIEAANLQSTAALADSLAAAATAPAAVVPATPVKRKLCSWHIVTVFLQLPTGGQSWSSRLLSCCSFAEFLCCFRRDICMHWELLGGTIWVNLIDAGRQCAYVIFCFKHFCRHTTS